MKHFLSFLSFLALTLIIGFSGCKKEQVDLTEDTPPGNNDSCNANYQDDIKPLIDTYCATAGCHGGAQTPQLGSYGELIDDTARIRQRALIDKTMPPAGQKQPTQDELRTISCWLENGALEN